MTIFSPQMIGRTFKRASAPAFDPSTLSPIAWWDPSDLTTMFQNSNGTTAVTTDGDPVGYIGDKSGHGWHLIQATAGKRPLYKTSGGLSWLQFDGSDDELAISHPSFGSGASVYFAVAPDAGEAQWLMAYPDSGGATFLGAVQASGSGTQNNAGTPTYRVNTVAPGGSTRQDLLTAIPAASTKQVTIESVDFSAAQWTSVLFSIGGYSSFELAGKIYGYFIVADLSSGNRASMETYMGAKAGLSI